MDILNPLSNLKSPIPPYGNGKKHRKHKPTRKLTSKQAIRRNTRRRRKYSGRTVDLTEPTVDVANGPDMKCSPAVKDTRAIPFSCYNADVLGKIKDAYNDSHRPAEQIKTTDPNEIWKQLKQRLVHCKKEDCWLRQIKDDTLRTQLQEYIFAPVKPPVWKTNPNEWLTNHDIIKVLQQYEQRYKNYEFINPTPIDFDTRLKDEGNQCVTEELCAFSLKQHIDSGKTKIGIVFNLDEHDEDGSHWMSMFIDVDDKVIFYFDSAGNDIPDEIKQLKDRIIKQGKKLDSPIEFEFHKNYPVAHQQGSSECGMYSLFFLITMLTSETEHDKHLTMDEKLHLFKKQRIPDKYVEQYRHVYFN
jgi:hypothetical protein